MCVCVYMYIYIYIYIYIINTQYQPWITTPLPIFHKVFSLFFFQSKHPKILLFLVEYYTIKADIFIYHLLPNFTALKLSNQKYKYVAVQKEVHSLYKQFYFMSHTWRMKSCLEKYNERLYFFHIVLSVASYNRFFIFCYSVGID